MEGRTAFFYGTLMELRVLHRVIYGSTTPHKSQLEALRINSAILQRYSRHRVVGCDYPAIVASSEPSACVRGTYVEGLTAADIWRLDIFEGDEYERVKVSPRLLTADGQVGEEIIGETYVWIKPVDMLEEREWDFDEFRREKLRHWVGGSAEYEEVDEAVLKAEDVTGGTGGRFVNGQMSSKFGGGLSGESNVLQSAA